MHDGINRGLINVDTVVVAERDRMRDTMRRHVIDGFEDTMVIFFGCVKVVRLNYNRDE